MFYYEKKTFRTHRISPVVAYWDPWLNDSERTRKDKNTKLTARKRKIRKIRKIGKNKVHQAVGRLVTIKVLQAECRSNLFVLFNRWEREMKFKKLLAETREN